MSRLLGNLFFLIGRSLHVFFGFGPCCRFRPSCSEYFRVAVRQEGLVFGAWLGLKRLVRCHPWGGSGYDPVPLSKRRRAFT